MGSTWSWLQWPSRGSRGIGPSGRWHPHCDEIVKGRGRVRNSHPSHTHMKLLHCSISLPLWHSIPFLTGAECIGCQSPNSQLRYRRPTKQPGKFDTRSNVVIHMKNYWVLRSSLIKTFFRKALVQYSISHISIPVCKSSGSLPKQDISVCSWLIQSSLSPSEVSRGPCHLKFVASIRIASHNFKRAKVRKLPKNLFFLISFIKLILQAIGTHPTGLFVFCCTLFMICISFSVIIPKVNWSNWVEVRALNPLTG